MAIILSNDLKSTIKKFFGTALIYATVINLLLLYNYYVMVDNRSNNLKSTITNTIIEFNDIDPEHLCNVTNCDNISIYTYNQNMYKNFSKSNGRFSFDNYTKNRTESYTTYATIGDVSLTKDLKFLYSIKDYGIFIIPEQSLAMQAIISSWLVMNTSFFLFFLIFFIHQELQIKKRNFQQVMGVTSILREKNLQLLTENVHHELNTPIAIINGLIRNLEIHLNSVGMSYTFDQIYAAIDQIKTVLDKMSNMKQIKYSNGNKTVYDIVSYGANAMTNYKKTNYVINVPTDLKKYGVDNKKLNNADVLNVVTNHFKNSLDAMADRIEVSAKYRAETKMLYLYIIDKGTGVRGFDGLILPKEKYENIFDPYWSTKNEKGEFIYGKINDSKNIFMKMYIKFLTDLKIWLTPEYFRKGRGIGLYLNRQFLTDVGGNIKLIETSLKGSVFLIMIPAYLKDLTPDDNQDNILEVETNTTQKGTV